MKEKRIPIIIDTDIGGDMDDTWALAMALKAPELDLKMVVTSCDDPMYRARIIAKMCERAGRTDVAVAKGLRTPDGVRYQAGWTEGYDLSKYPGKVYEDGIGAMIDLIRNSEEEITLITIGNTHNIPELLKRAPEVAGKVRVIGMFGSVYTGYPWDNGKISKETNVVSDISSAKIYLSSFDKIEITPLDTCKEIVIDKERMERIVRKAKTDPLVSAILENFEVWKHHGPFWQAQLGKHDFSSDLYDTVAVYMAITHENLEFERLKLSVDDAGYTVIDRKNGHDVDVAVRWKDKEKFIDYLTNVFLA